jgi:hypothetical protein
MILGDLPEPLAQRLWEKGYCRWNGYSIRYRDRKEFSVGRTGLYARVWDCFGYFQQSFVRAIATWLGVDTEAMERMKRDRPNFTIDQLPEIEKYCADECAKLETLMNRVYDAAVEADVKLTRWDGAGAVAAAMLKRESVDDYFKPIRGTTESIARAAYFGGRIECVRFGHTDGRVYAYDLRSAYPAALAKVPCLAHGRWTVETGEVIAPVSLYRVEWHLEGSALPFPWRDAHGAVYFPERGRGWYWCHEVNVAREALRCGIVRGYVKVLASAVWIAACDHRPFAWIPETFALRAQWKRESRAAEKILKLGLNSLYGKCAQRVGGKNLAPPRWHNMLWAGWTTSATRAALYRASFDAIRNRALIAYATDAVMSTCPLSLETGAALGQWESAVHESATFVQSGVYWLGRGDAEIEHTRGFLRGEFGRSDALDCWRRGQWQIETETVRFRGIGTAIVMKQGKWRTWQPQKRVLRLEPTGTKRALRVASLSQIKPYRNLIETVPADTTEQIVRTGIDSCPISVPWIKSRGWNGSAYDVADRAQSESEAGYA